MDSSSCRLTSPAPSTLSLIRSFPSCSAATCSAANIPDLPCAITSGCRVPHVLPTENWRRVAILSTLHDHVCIAEHTPHVDHRFAGKIKLAIGGMGCAQDQDVAAVD